MNFQRFCEEQKKNSGPFQKWDVIHKPQVAMYASENRATDIRGQNAKHTWNFIFASIIFLTRGTSGEIISEISISQG